MQVKTNKPIYCYPFYYMFSSMFVRQFPCLDSIQYIYIYLCEVGCTFVATHTHCRCAHPWFPDFPTGRPSRRKEWETKGGGGGFGFFSFWICFGFA